MGFWKSAFRLVQDVTSLGGTIRLRANIETFERLKSIYERVCQQISECNGKIVVLVQQIQKQMSISERQLKKAERILNPLRYKGDLATGASLAFGKNAPLPATNRTTRSNFSSETVEYAPIIVGAGAGAAAAAGTWGAVQVFGGASTGAAMAGLHGAAAANAGWAWFGGGSLAAGGGGMALGHLVLPGIGTVVAVAVSATMSHSEANKIARYCEELETANVKNSSTLSIAESNLWKLERLDVRIHMENNSLSSALREAKRNLLPFGYFSHLWRLLRFRFKGYYYTAEEFIHVDRLGSAVSKFVNAFKHG